MTAAASAARSARGTRSAHVVRWAVAALSVTTVVGTGGIAVAGALPGPMQTVVADISRALPVPFHIPYPTVGSAGVTTGEAADRRGPEDAGALVDEYEPIGVEADGPESSPGPQSAVPDDSSETEHDPGQEDMDRDRCGLRDVENARSELDAQEAETVRDHIRQVCDPDFADPPRFTLGDGAEDADQSSKADRHGNEGDGDRRDRDRDRSGRHEGDGTDHGSSGSEGSDETEDNWRDEQEDRHEDDEDGHDRSSNGEWRDGHD